MRVAGMPSIRRWRAFALAAAPFLPALLPALLTAAPARDYAGGFARLRELGLPDATGATYVRLSGEYVRLFTEGQFKGNAWLLGEQSGKGTLIVDQKKVAVYEREAPDSRESRAWKPADLDADAKTLAKMLDQGEIRHADYFGGDSLDLPTVALFFSAHLHAVGKREEANALATKLFADPTVASITLANALNALATVQYDAALDTLAKTNDWAFLRDTVARLRAKFGVRWSLDAGAALLLERLEARIQGVPEPKGDGLTDAQRALARELADRPWIEPESAPVFWLLPEPPEQPPPESTSLKHRILVGGVETLPLLIALLDDETLTPGTSDGGDRWNARDEDEDLEPAERTYRHMKRPTTRGELAHMLLARVLPAEDESSDAASDDAEEVEAVSFRDQATALYAQLRGKDTTEIVRFYLGHKRKAAREQILEALIEHADLARYAADVETALLELETEHGGPHVQYLAERGAAARPFAERLLAKLRVRLAELETPPPKPTTTSTETESLFGAGSQDRDTESQRRLLKDHVTACEELLSDKTLDDHLKEILGGQAAHAPSHRFFFDRLAKVSPQETTPTLLKAAIAASTAEKAAEVLGIPIRMARWRLYGGARRYGRHGDAAKQAMAAYDPEPDRALWEVLLADNRTPANGGLWARSVAHGAAKTLHSLCGDIESGPGVANLERLPAARVERLWIAQARKLAAGTAFKDLPPMVIEPAPGVAETLASRLAAVDAGETAAFLERLTDTEYLALVRRTDDDPATRARFAPLARRVRAVHDAPTDFPVKAGDELSVEAVQTVVEWAKTAARAKQSWTVRLSRECAPADGFAVMVAPPSPGDGMGYGSPRLENRKSNAQVHATVRADHDYTSEVWDVPNEEPPPDSPAPAKGEADDALPEIVESPRRGGGRRPGDLWKALAPVFADKDFNPFSVVEISIAIYQPTPPDGAKDEKGEDDDAEGILDFN